MKHYLKYFSVFFKFIAILMGCSMLVGFMTGFPFKLIGYTYFEQVIIWIMFITVGPCYLLPNDFIIRKKICTVVFIGSLLFVLAILYEVAQEVIATKTFQAEYLIPVVASISAPLSLVIELKSS